MLLLRLRWRLDYKRCSHDINLIRGYDAVAIKNLLIGLLILSLLAQTFCLLTFSSL